MNNMIALNQEKWLAQLPLDAGQYIYEALMCLNRESDYESGSPDDKIVRKYNLLFLIALKNVLNNKNIEAFRKKFTPEDVVDGYGPLPKDFLSTYQYFYELRIKVINGVQQLCGLANMPIEYVAVPECIGSLPHQCIEAIKKRFLYECKTIDTAFESKTPILLQDYNTAMADWMGSADLYNNANKNRQQLYPFNLQFNRGY